MEKIYKDIWMLARPYYEKGRSYDIHHIEWMMKEAEKVADIESLDKKILMPIVILHDVGYSAVDDKNPNNKGKESKILHMKKGAEISKKILKEVGYISDLSDKIVHYISVHDNWIINDDSPFLECEEMAAFNDLDFIYAVCDINVLKKQTLSRGETLDGIREFWLNDEKLTRRPLCCSYTKKLFEQCINNLEKAGL